MAMSLTNAAQQNNALPSSFPPRVAPRVAVFKWVPLLNHATAQMNRALATRRLTHQHSIRGSPIEPSVETLSRVHTPSSVCQGLLKRATLILNPRTRFFPQPRTHLVPLEFDGSLLNRVAQVSQLVRARLPVVAVVLADEALQRELLHLWHARTAR